MGIVRVKDVEQAMQWYERVLGWSSASDDSGKRVLLDDGTSLEVVSDKEEMTCETTQPLKLETERLLKLHTLLRRAQANVSKVMPHPSGLQFTFEDPDGNTFLAWQDTGRHPVRGVCRVP